MMRRFVLVPICLVLALVFLPAPVSGDYACTNCFSSVSSGGGHSCAVRDDASLACWGDGSLDQTTPPSQLPNYEYLQASAGAYHSCAIFNCYPEFPVICPIVNTLCWGANHYGQVTGQPSGDFFHVSAGLFHSCGVRGNGSIECWGLDDSDQAPPGVMLEMGEFTHVSAGGTHTCAVVFCTGGGCPSTNASCWGSDSEGQSSVPATSTPYDQISAGYEHTCARKTDGSVKCWGNDSQDQCSPPAGNFVKVSAGYQHSCGLKADGTVACWGSNVYGESSAPVGRFRDVSASLHEFFSCGVRLDGSMTCWGEGINNQLAPPAGLCGLFHGDFEEGGDCQWSNGSLPCWSADCDHDGYASRDAIGRCLSMPMGAPAHCLSGTWTARKPHCGDYDCQDGNADVYSGQTSFFTEPFWPYDGLISDRFDYNCDGVEERLYSSMASNVCCGPVGGQCLAFILPGCDRPGWKAGSASGIPECGEADQLLTCGGTAPTCYPTTVTATQACR